MWIDKNNMNEQDLLKGFSQVRIREREKMQQTDGLDGRTGRQSRQRDGYTDR